jgi:HPt (histidine-containing phosphotransfer) domain-containing protein
VSPTVNDNAPDTGAPPAPALDESVLAALAAELSDALMPELVATFVAEARGRVAAVEQAAADGDCARAGEQGHALKGSAGTFGAAALHDLASALETAGREGDLVAVRALVPRLRARGEEVLGLLQARYAAPPMP